jgi:hypothetical protein
MNAANQSHAPDDTAEGRPATERQAVTRVDEPRANAVRDRQADPQPRRAQQAEATEPVVRPKRLRDLRHLTLRDRRFLRRYIELGGKRSGSQAMRDVGFTGREPKLAAFHTLAKPGVREYLEQVESMELEEIGVTQRAIVEDIVDIRQKAKELGGSKGLAVALKANDMLGKFKKLWVDQPTPHSPSTTVNDNRVLIQIIKFADMPEARAIDQK